MDVHSNRQAKSSILLVSINVVGVGASAYPNHCLCKVSGLPPTYISGVYSACSMQGLVCRHTGAFALPCEHERRSHMSHVTRAEIWSQCFLHLTYSDGCFDWLQEDQVL